MLATWKWVALPMSATIWPLMALVAMRRARSQAPRSCAWCIEPSQAKLNWQPRLPEPWNTTAQTDLGKAGWCTRLSTTWATAAWPDGVSPRAS